MSVDLTVLTPAAPNRKPRIEMIFNRLALNYKRHPNINFEFVIVDDSLNAEYRELSQSNWPFAVKYISLPLSEQYPNPSYMRNVGFRIAQGEIFTMIDADHWIHEDFIEGALEPYRNLPVVIDTTPSVLNTGFMIDTSKGNMWSVNSTNINNELILKSKYMVFKHAMNLTGINGPVLCNRVWLAAYPGKAFLDINGYDEQYTTGYSREDDDIYYRLKAYLTHVHTNSFAKFAGVHLWHPQAARSQALNELNKKYYSAVSPTNYVRNQKHRWGNFVSGSYSIIDGVERSFSEHEMWIEENMDIGAYTEVSDVPWKHFTELRNQYA